MQCAFVYIYVMYVRGSEKMSEIHFKNIIRCSESLQLTSTRSNIMQMFVGTKVFCCTVMIESI